MDLYNEFLSYFYNGGFKFSNSAFSIDSIKNKLDQNQIYLKRSADNFFLTQNDFITYFINDIAKFDMQGTYIKIIRKTPICELENRFLSINKFSIFDRYIGMSLKNSGFGFQSYDEVKKALLDDMGEIYDFFIKYFDKNYLFISKTELKNRIQQGQVLIIKQDKKILGALVYFLNLNSAHLDFVAVSKEFRKSGIGRKLMSCFLGLNAWCFKLFVRDTNIKAIEFYKKFGFEFNDIRIWFYKRKNEI
ncbi:GNAT family N-acetyltransferase [Campylobacter hyointestinalis]|uniref:GNAT family N-acetyltransferase n=1 Tax=Campylobacter hyointestinalis TaxID=198 RepID=UPI000DCBFE10|nr:GNAT family N-acetyltransferase [Campylobacter hyointestinalis]RAZ46654.1 GNAT family N-acetyltransferase [Campylobacter hyointestinalis subsp. lawsonii]